MLGTRVSNAGTGWMTFRDLRLDVPFVAVEPGVEGLARARRLRERRRAGVIAGVLFDVDCCGGRMWL